jgi:ADP-ribosyl-[dinitrogen reductase] hydrolase
VTALMANHSLSDMLISCIDFQGDVDTVAAIAMGPAALAVEIANDIPETLRRGLENGPWGRPYLQRRDAELVDFARKNGAVI